MKILLIKVTALCNVSGQLHVNGYWTQQDVPWLPTRDTQVTRSVFSNLLGKIA